MCRYAKLTKPNLSCNATSHAHITCALWQASPKGGWWSHVATTLTEYDVYIYRAILVLASEDEWPLQDRSHMELRRSILDGWLGNRLFDRVSL